MNWSEAAAHVLVFVVACLVVWPLCCAGDLWRAIRARLPTPIYFERAHRDRVSLQEAQARDRLARLRQSELSYFARAHQPPRSGEGAGPHVMSRHRGAVANDHRVATRISPAPPHTSSAGTYIDPSLIVLATTMPALTSSDGCQVDASPTGPDCSI